MILNGVTQLRGLDTFVWVVTNELLRVTELYIDQCDNKVEKNRKADKNNSMSSPVKVSDSIPILKPVPGLDTNDNVDEQQQQTQTADTPQQVDIVQLKVKLFYFSRLNEYLQTNILNVGRRYHPEQEIAQHKSKAPEVGTFAHLASNIRLAIKCKAVGKPTASSL